MDSDLLQISIAEYQELLEEIRSGRESVWVAMAAYLALTGALLGILRPTGLSAAAVPFIMVALGILVAAHIFRIRRDNSINFARVWNIEHMWRTVTKNQNLGARWNPWDSSKLEIPWRLPAAAWNLGLRKGRLPRKRLGTIDFGLIVLDSFVVVFWLLYAVAVRYGADSFTEGWLVLYILLAAVTWEIIAILWWQVARQERAVIDKWKTEHPQPPGDTESSLKTGRDTERKQLPAEGKDGL